jgi:DnaK suppressor protein
MAGRPSLEASWHIPAPGNQAEGRVAREAERVFCNNREEARGTAMDDDRARELLAAERQRVERMLEESLEAAQEDRDAVNETVDVAEPSERFTAEQVDDALVERLRERLGAIERAEARLRAGTYGRSVRSGMPIPDERLEADPAAELTLDEAVRRT